MTEFHSCPNCRGAGVMEIACGRCHGRGSINTEAISCPICGDTYLDLWDHLASGRKGCGDKLLENAR